MPVCPACHLVKMMWWTKPRSTSNKIVQVEQFLYQFSYPGSPDYISLRCLDCLDKEYLRRLQSYWE